ncbi:hypothetical protein SAMN05444352_10891 [Pseudomonas japonica]|uniref:Uncharacterized protein n=1 Tax=Pseudomonas japonica TaxID=256466 RepID=A0A239EPM2_9PSED|nr:hypothetical protein SAMN05444352_10891 [Pseudomonas japonica]
MPDRPWLFALSARRDTEPNRQPPRDTSPQDKGWQLNSHRPWHVAIDVGADSSAMRRAGGARSHRHCRAQNRHLAALMRFPDKPSRMCRYPCSDRAGTVTPSPRTDNPVPPRCPGIEVQTTGREGQAVWRRDGDTDAAPLVGPSGCDGNIFISALRLNRQQGRWRFFFVWLSVGAGLPAKGSRSGPENVIARIGTATRSFRSGSSHDKPAPTGGQSREAWPQPLARLPCACCATLARIRGSSSWPYSTASRNWSKPRNRKVVTPRL